MVRVVRQRRQRLADAATIGPMPPSSCHAGNQRAFDLFLQVEDREIRFAAQVVAKQCHFPPRARIE